MVTIRDGFENGFYAFSGVGEMTCPNGWVPVWVDDPREGILDRPEWKPAGQAQVRNGTGAAAIHSRYSTIDGALVRTVSVNPGDTVIVSGWCLKTEDAEGHGQVIGIDPDGESDINGGNIAWSDWYSQYEPDYKVNEWRQRRVSTVAESNLVTVFLRSRVDFAVDGSNAHFDDIEIQIVGEEPEPEPEPDPDPIETLTVELLINGDSVFRQEYVPEVTSVVLRPLGCIVAQLMGLLKR